MNFELNPHTRTPAHLHIFLLGLMGTGKTYWAQQLSVSCRMDWVDLDAEIEKETMLSIAEIFETEGEEFFRRKEKEALHHLSKHHNIIIATGGGAPCFHNNMDWMNENGITIWIDEPVEILVKRLQPEKKHRPLIKDLNDSQLHEFLSKNLKERNHFYGQAKYHLQGDEVNEHHFIQIIQQYA